MSIVTIKPGYRGTLHTASNTVYRGAPGATATADTGVMLSTGDADLELAGITFRGNGPKGDGIRAITKGVRRVRVTDCTFDNFTNGATIHHPDHDNLSRKIPADEWCRDVEFTGVRLVNMAGVGDKSGHGIHTAQVDGLTFDGFFIDGAGRAGGGARKIWVHGAYIAAGCRRVVFRNGIVHDDESVGLQLRGPLERADDPDDGSDPGPLIENVVIVNCPIGVLVNGPRATLRNVLIVVGPHHAGPGTTTTGECGVYASVGKLTLENVLIVRDTVDHPGEDIAPVLNNPRPPKDTYGDGRTLKRWEWNKPTSTVGTADVRLDKRVDLSDLIERARNGEPVKPLIAAAFARAKGQPVPTTPTPTPVPDIVDVPAPAWVKVAERADGMLDVTCGEIDGATGYSFERDGTEFDLSGNAHAKSTKTPGVYTARAIIGTRRSKPSAPTRYGMDPTERARLEARLLEISTELTGIEATRDELLAERAQVVAKLGQ